MVGKSLKSLLAYSAAGIFCVVLVLSVASAVIMVATMSAPPPVTSVTNPALTAQEAYDAVDALSARADSHNTSGVIDAASALSKLAAAEAAGDTTRVDQLISEAEDGVDEIDPDTDAHAKASVAVGIAWSEVLLHRGDKAGALKKLAQVRSAADPQSNEAAAAIDDAIASVENELNGKPRASLVALDAASSDARLMREAEAYLQAARRLQKVPAGAFAVSMYLLLESFE